MMMVPKAEEIAALNAQCFHWQTPQSLFVASDTLSELLQENALLRPGRAFREAYVASRFAMRRGASEVRLVRERQGQPTPDFEVRIGGETFAFETTEADVPGRRRGDEYKRPRTTERMIFTNLEAMVEQMRALATKKAAKAYENCRGLVIHVNPPAFAFNPQLRWESLVRGGEPAALVFPEVWAIRGTGSLLWLNGVPQPEIEGEKF